MFDRVRRLLPVAGCAMCFAALCHAGLAEGASADAVALIRAQDARLGGSAGTIVLDRASRLGSDVTVGVGHALRIDAPLTVSKGSIHLLGHNAIRCNAGVTVENATELFVADGATDISVSGCDVEVTGRAGGYLLVATRSARIAAEGNHLLNLALFNTHNLGGSASQTTDVTLANDSVDFTKPGGPIGVYLLYVRRGVVADNRFRGTLHGVEWWGGDANTGWRSAAEVTGAGELSITGNVCSAAGGACVWGSMGFDVTVSGNTAEICSDVCFDTEGGVRNLFTGNVARACMNGCYAAEFESQDAVFSGNMAYADAKSPSLALVLIKHPAGRGPNHVNLTVTGNTLVCGDHVCEAFYSEGEDGLVLADNTITNGAIMLVNYTNAVLIQGNTLRFTAPMGANAAITGPSVYNGHRSEIADNSISAEAGANPNAVCIAQSWSDNNSSDEMRLVRNTCEGFPHGIVTETAGHNAGAPHAVWLLEGNQFAGTPEAEQIVHRHSSGNEVYTSVPGAGATK